MRKLMIAMALVAGVGSLGLASTARAADPAVPPMLPHSTAKPAACYGFGPYCPPGTTRRCGYYGRCWCAPCW